MPENVAAHLEMDRSLEPKPFDESACYKTPDTSGDTLSAGLSYVYTTVATGSYKSNVVSVVKSRAPKKQKEAYE